MHQSPLARWEKWTAGICIAITLSAIGTCAVTLYRQSQPEEAGVVDSSNDDAFAEVSRTGEFHEKLSIVADIPGVDDPGFTDATFTSLNTNDEVIGIVVADQAFAFARNRMNSPAKHIINLCIDENPVSVTYCDMVDEVRVLHRPRGARPIELRVGGMDIHRRLVFLLDGVRYGQGSPDVPLADHAFERTTLELWIAEHPNTMIYEG